MAARRSDSRSGGGTSRRSVLKAAAAVTGSAALGLSGSVAASALEKQAPRVGRTLVGAIRWDAYTGGHTRHGMGSNRILSPEKFHFRMPYFSDITVDQPVLLYQGFDAETTGAAPSGWTVSAGSATSVSVVQGPDREGKSVHLHDTSATGSATMGRAFAAQNRAITVRWDWKETVAGRWSRALVTGGSTTVVDIATRQDTAGKQLVCRTPSGSWQVLQTIADDTWYSFKVIVDPAPPEGATPWVDIFVDGARKAYHIPLLGSPAAFDKLHFQTNPSLTSDLYVDNANVVVTESVNCEGTSQAVMDQEIRYAAAAGIDYWAFDYYPQQPLAKARELYLSSALKDQVKWCAILDGNFMTAYDTNLAELVARFGESNYQKVLDGRPLIYFLSEATADRVTKMRAKATAAGLPDPYIVVMGWTAQGAADAKASVGADAVSRYATGQVGGAPYSSLTSLESGLWSDYAGAGGQVVPTVTTGWDPRPQYDYPPPWGQQPSDNWLRYKDEWTQQATPAEIAAHLGDAISWSNSHAVNVPANAVLIYAWNEHLEGGWICPTLHEIQNSGRPLRLDAIAGVPRTGAA
ncbi:hypothetical protein JK364_49000 [Streptomyces sp. 110]|uniref:Uncharacterized protein n=1 Tax=Streptomyces endocoffeicus TaxID=2898945 RepID=A0ABS1Q737_9ACTN|nr:hypothetical protein [Streptomyces endocoffeicus]MBL1120180.1 hypothetical protein [Streptomyces endocoffeicus]